MKEDFNFDRCVTLKEGTYFSIMLAISIIFYLICIVSIVGFLYILLIALSLFFAQAVAIATIKQNSIKVSHEQFGDVYQKVVEYSNTLDLGYIPEVYLMQSNGLLNAFVTRFLFKDIVVIYSDIFELAYEQGETAVNFIVAHELAHVKRKHLSLDKYILFGKLIPFLGLAYSRACEQTCDRIAYKLVGELGYEGLILLAAGKKLYKKVNVELFLSNASLERNFWSWFSEICSTHPHLSSRVRNLKDINERFRLD